MGTLIQFPCPLFTDVDGKPLDDGYIFIGIAGLNPLSNPQQAYFDGNLTVPAVNIRTKGGYPVYNGSPARIYTLTGSFSILVRNKQGSHVYSNTNVIDYFNSPSGEVIHKVATIADLRTFYPVDPSYPVQVLGYYNVGDGGGGPLRYWDAASTATDNGGSVIAVTGHTIGRWLFDARIELDIRWFGCKNTVVDPIFDNATILNSLNSVLTNSSAVLIPVGTFLIKSTVDWSSKSDLQIRFFGQLSTYQCTGLRLTDCQRINILNATIVETSPGLLVRTDSGLLFKNSSTGDVKVKLIRGFKYGLHLLGDNGGVAYCAFYLQYLTDNYYNLYIESNGTGWVTENSFYNGRFDLSSGVYATLTNDYAIYMKNGGSFNNLRFYNPSIEGQHYGIHMYGSHFLMESARFESVANYYVDGVVERSDLGFGFTSDYVSLARVNLGNASTYNMIRARDLTGKYVIAVSALNGSFGFLNDDGLTVLRNFSYAVNEDALTLVGPGGTNRLNKMFERSAIPTTGTFGLGAFVWNTAYTGDSVKTVGWVCISTGTMGTLVGITANTTSGSRLIQLNSITGVYPGCRIIINSVGFVVDAANSITNVISVTVAPTFTGAGYAVTYASASFKAVTTAIFPQSSTSAAVGYLGYADVASGASFTLPSDAGSVWDWEVLTYGATLTSGGSPSMYKLNEAAGTVLSAASANLRLRYFRRS